MWLNTVKYIVKYIGNMLAIIVKQWYYCMLDISVLKGNTKRQFLYIRNVINCREYLYVGIYIIKCMLNQYTLYINEVTLKDIYYYIGIIIDSRE